MLIKQTRIRGTKKLLSDVYTEKTFVLGLIINEEVMSKLNTIAYNAKIEVGVQIFPDPELGIMSERNAIGEYIPQKDLPKETAYRAQEWELRDWRGYPHNGVSYVPYERYPRKFIPPKELRLAIVRTSNEERLVIVNKRLVNSSVTNEIYSKLLSDKLPANLGYLYENAVAQLIASTDHELYYHTWEKPNSTHYYEIDFLVSVGEKTNAIEVKSSGVGKFESLKEFSKKYSKILEKSYLFSQKDRSKQDGIDFLPIYMLNFTI